jgi:ankyrin repeat protein
MRLNLQLLLNQLIVIRFHLTRTPIFSDLKDSMGNSLLHLAAEKGRVDCALVLMLHGA